MALNERLKLYTSRYIPVEVMTGLIFACLERASMHSSFVMWKIKHFSIKCCT